MALSEPRVSFVIPVLNEADNIADTLKLLRRDFPGAELVVVDGGSSDTTKALANPISDTLIDAPRGRARQMNAGAAVAKGDYLFFLHADTRPLFTERALLEAIDDGPYWGFCRLRLRGAKGLLKVVEWGINCRTRMMRRGTGDQLQFVSSELFEQIGGFADIPLMEDVALCRMLKQVAPPRLLSLVVSTSSRRWRQNGVVKTVLLMWRLQLSYALGASPENLWRRYYRD